MQFAVLPLLAAALFLTACNKPQTSQAPTPPAPPVSQAKLDAEVLQALSEPAGESPTPDSPSPASRSDAAADLMRRYPDKNAKELLETPEAKEKLGEVLKELAQRKDLQDRINSSVAAAASLKGLDPTPGRHAFKLDVTGYSEDRTHQMLAAVMTGSASRVVDFLVGEVGAATPDLSLGGLQTSANGISIDPVPPPAKP